MKKKLIILFLFLIFPFFVSAYTKEDIIKLVDNQKTCDQETENMYSKYFNIYSRLLKKKDVSEGDLNQIHTNLTKALVIANKYNLCSIDDLDNIPKKEKSELYNYLYDSYKLILKSKNLDDTETNVIYNGDGTIDIYENGEHLEQIKTAKDTFNYVGLSKYFVYLKYLLPFSLIVIFIFVMKTRKKIFINEILIILLVIDIILTLVYFKAGNKIYDAYNLIKSMSYIENKEVTKIEVKNKKIIKYPSFGSKYGVLKIDNLGINLPIFYGDSKEILKKGIGHSQSFPGFGGTTILSGHNSKIFLNSLKNIKISSLIEVETDYGAFIYKVRKIEILNTDQYSKLEKGKNEIILYTCYPFDEIVYSNQRFVVYASLIESKWLNG